MTTGSPTWSLSPKVAPALSRFMTRATTTNTTTTKAALAQAIRAVRIGRASTTRSRSDVASSSVIALLTAGRRGCR